MFSDDEKKVLFVLSYLKKGHVTTWAQNYIKSVINTSGGVMPTDSFMKFIEKLVVSFDDPNWQEKALKEF